MTKTDAALACYPREVRDRLPCSRGERERILDRLRAGGEELLAAEPTVDCYIDRKLHLSINLYQLDRQIWSYMSGANVAL